MKGIKIILDANTLTPETKEKFKLLALKKEKELRELRESYNRGDFDEMFKK